MLADVIFLKMVYSAYVSISIVAVRTLPWIRRYSRMSYERVVNALILIVLCGHSVLTLCLPYFKAKS